MDNDIQNWYTIYASSVGTRQHIELFTLGSPLESQELSSEQQEDWKIKYKLGGQANASYWYTTG